MNLYTRIGMFFFTVGALLTILASVFPAQGILVPIINATLVFTGLFAGILNITSDEEHQFLVSGVVFLVSLLALETFFGAEFPTVLRAFMQNAALFIGTMTVLVSIRNILEMASQNYSSTPLERMRQRTKELELLERSTAQRVWDFIIFLAVALTFVLLLMDAFFYAELSPTAKRVVELLDWVVIILFLIDIVVLWRERESAPQFFKECWPDIIAAIPVTKSFFGLFKLVRITRLARLMHAARIGRVHRSAKFFSTKSGFHTYLEGKANWDEPAAPPSEKASEKWLKDLKAKPASKRATRKRAVKTR